MLQSEFYERTGFMPTYDEYLGIEEMYYSFDADKDAFCAHFKSHKTTMLSAARKIACDLFSAERARMNETIRKAENEKHLYELKIAQMQNMFDSEKSKLEKALEFEKADLKSMCIQRNNAQNERDDALQKLSQALKDVESLKNAIRLLKA